LRDRKRSKQQPNLQLARLELLGVERQQRDDYPEADETDENRDKDRQQRAAFDPLIGFGRNPLDGHQ
jgi:hypothetical protein